MRSFILALLVLGATTAWADDAPKRLSATDLRVQTHKWDGKSIQVNARCLYADKDEYRCLVAPLNGNETVRIDFSSIEPDTMKDAIENNCDTVDKMPTKACRVNIVFTYESNDLQEKAEGSSLMLLVAANNKGVFSKAK